MSNYSPDEDMVRVDFFKPSGKWYCTEAVKWTGGWPKDNLIGEAFRKSLKDHFGGQNRMLGMDVVCLEPYHEMAHPLMIKNLGELK